MVSPLLLCHQHVGAVSRFGSFMRERGWWSDEEDEALRKGERKALLKALAQVKGGHGCMHQRLVCLLVRIGLWLTHELHLLSVAFARLRRSPSQAWKTCSVTCMQSNPSCSRYALSLAPLSAPLAVLRL